MEQTAERVCAGIRAAAEAGAQGLTGTADALLDAAAESIAPAVREAAQEMKQLFPDPHHLPREAAVYAESLKIAVKTGAACIAGTVLGCGAAVTDAVIPAAVKGARGVEKAFAGPEKSKEDEDGIL